MSTTTPPQSPPGPPALLSGTVPPLHNGDRLTRDEFHRRYEAMPQINKAELIEGVVYMPSPVRHGKHSSPQFNLIGWLHAYVAHTPGLEGGDNGTLKLDMKNEPQPDAYVIIAPACGGQVKIDKDDYIVGSPELVAEVSASSASIDSHDKMEGYRRNRAREYVVWRVFDQAIDWFVLRGDRFEPLALGPDGIFHSEILPGLWLDPQALIAGNALRVLEVVQAGVNSPEHAAFVQKLEQARRSRQS